LLAARLLAREAPADDTPASERTTTSPPPPEDVRHTSFGSYELSGEAALGLHLLDVGGNEAQFNEDQNLERGIFLRDLSVSGKRVAGDSGPASFSLEALGIGTNAASARAETSVDGIDVRARYAHTRFSGTSTTDIHSFDFERETGSLSLARDAHDGTVRRAGVELTFARRDGFTLGTRSVNNGFVSDVPVDQDERRLGAAGQLGLRLGEFELDLAAGVEDLDTRDRRSFQAPHPRFPQRQVSEDFAADTDGLAHHGSVRLSRACLAGSLDVDAGVAWHVVNADGTLDRHETGIFNDPDLPFVSDTQGDTDFDGRALSTDAGLTWEVADETEVDLRFTHEHERDDGLLVRTVTLDELTGDPPTVSTLADDVHHESRLELLEAGVRAPLGRRIDVDLSLEAGREEIEVEDVSDQIVVRRFDGTVDRFGGEGRLSAEMGLAQTLELAAGYGNLPTESSRIGVEFTFDDTRTSFGSLAWRWRPRADASLSSEIKHEQRESDAFGSEGEFDSLSLSGSTALESRFSLDASFTYRTFDSKADTTFIVSNPGPTQIDGTVSFEGIQRIASAGAAWEATDVLHPRLWASLSQGSGDGSFDYGAFDLDVPYRLSARFELGGDLSWIRFDGDDSLSARDYDAWVLTLYARASF
jgi:hypothetical protein